MTPIDWADFFEFMSTGFLLLVMLVGLFGLIIPIFPGGVVIWVAALIYGIVAGFGVAGWIIFAVLTLLMIAIGLADNVLMGAKALEKGASWYGIALALVAGLVGTFLLPPIGGLIAAPLMLLLVEYFRHSDIQEAWLVTKGLLVGWGWSFVVRFGLGVVMIVLWGIWVWANGRA
ncbi:MAG: DUF456 domain-containing protein [Anaerolineales bacterium]|nr:DUF456 domain-containing protein [Anaerolineales bacterium]